MLFAKLDIFTTLMPHYSCCLNQEPKSMESYWCLKKNTMPVLMKDPHNYNPALTPCLKAKCDTWDEGKCFHIRKAGKKELTDTLF